MDDEEVLGFPGGPPHPPYGDPLEGETDTRDDAFAGLPDRPPQGAPSRKPKVKKKKAKRKKTGRPADQRAEAKEGSDGAPWWRSRNALLAAVAVVAIMVRQCADAGERQDAALLLGGLDVFLSVEIELCEDGLVMDLAAEEEMPSAAPPPDPGAVEGKGIGKALWATRMGGIIEPHGLSARFWGEHSQTVTLEHPELTLLQRVTRVGTKRANHYMAIDYSSGAVEWQQVMLGTALGSSAEHVWLGSTAGPRSAVLAAMEMTTGDIVACYAAHSSSDEGPPPVLEVLDGLVRATSPTVVSEQGLYVEASGLDGPIQHLVPGSDPINLPIPTGRSIWEMVAVTNETLAISPLSSDPNNGSLQGWSTTDLSEQWGVDFIGERVDAGASSSSAIVVHERARKRDESLTVALDPATGETLWEKRHDRALLIADAGLHVHESSAVLTAHDLDTNRVTTQVLTTSGSTDIDKHYLAYATDDRIGLVSEPSRKTGTTKGKLVTLGPDGQETICSLEEVDWLLGFNEKIVVAEITIQGEPWLVGVELKSQSGGGGGGGHGRGGGKGKDGGGGSGGDGDGKGGGGDGPPST